MTQEDPLDPENARTLRFLKTLVTVLTATMIIGVLTITALLVIRLQRSAPPAFPATITLPNGTEAEAYTQGPGWHAVATTDGRILIFDAGDGALLHEIEIRTTQD